MGGTLKNTFIIFFYLPDRSCPIKFLVRRFVKNIFEDKNRIIFLKVKFSSIGLLNV